MLAAFMRGNMTTLLPQTPTTTGVATYALLLLMVAAAYLLLLLVRIFPAPHCTGRPKSRVPEIGSQRTNEGPSERKKPKEKRFVVVCCVVLMRRCALAGHIQSNGWVTTNRSQACFTGAGHVLTAKRGSHGRASVALSLLFLLWKGGVARTECWLARSLHDHC